MPSKLESGKFIFSASEVAEYTYCPMNWYLSKVEKVVSGDKIQEKIEQGDRLHREWASDYAEGITISRLLRWLVALSIASIVVLLVRYS